MKSYPTTQQYKTALLFGQDSFRTLKNVEVVMSPDHPSDPLFITGGFAIVFKIIVDGKPYALKCFIRDVEDRIYRLEKISEYLRNNPSDYFVDFQYLEDELWVGQTDKGWDVVLMEWVEGDNLLVYLDELCVGIQVLGKVKKNELTITNPECDKLNKQKQLASEKDVKAKLLVLFNKLEIMFNILRSLPIAHGDLKPDNIIYTAAGKIKLVDYDGMFVPALSGMDAAELGSPHYQIPFRTYDNFSEGMDEFSINVILYSIRYLYRHAWPVVSTKTDWIVINGKDNFSELLSKHYRVMNAIDEKCMTLHQNIIHFTNPNYDFNFWNKITPKWRSILLDSLYLTKKFENVDKPSYGLLCEILAANKLVIKTNEILNLDTLSCLVNLESIEIERTSVALRNRPSDTKKLESRTYDGNQIQDIAPLANLTKLKHVALINNNIKDISPIKNLKKLITLDLSDNEITNISALSSLTKIVRLNLSKNNIPNLSPLSRFNELKHFVFRSGGVTDISVLKLLRKVEYIDLTYTEFDSIIHLKKLSNLRELHISEAQEFGAIDTIFSDWDLKDLLSYPIKNLSVKKGGKLRVFHDGKMKPFTYF